MTQAASAVCLRRRTILGVRLAEVRVSLDFDRNQAAASSLGAPASVANAAWSRALEFERSGNYRLARERLDECLADRTLDAADVHFHLGWCLEAEGKDPESAIAHYAQAAASAVDAALAINARYRAGLLALKEESYEQATALLEAARKATAASPGMLDLDQHIAYWLGVCFEADGRLLAAIALYDEVGRDGTPLLRAEARYRRLQALVSIGDFDAALQTAETLITSSRDGGERITQLAQLAAEEKRQLLLARTDA
jgi:tetratricopeptide (TPR) repeat protein